MLFRQEKAALRMEQEEEIEYGAADEEDDAEDDETDAVDDSRGNDPFVHRLLILVSLITQFLVSTQSCLQQVSD